VREQERERERERERKREKEREKERERAEERGGGGCLEEQVELRREGHFRAASCQLERCRGLFPETKAMIWP
jgi:hypothetical protein